RGRRRAALDAHDRRARLRRASTDGDRVVAPVARDDLAASAFLRSGGEAGAQLRGGQALGVRSRSGLMLAPALRERAGVDSVEADLVDQLRDCSLRLLVVARDRDTEPLGIAGGTAVVAQAHPLDRVERLDHTSARKVCLQQLARGGALAIELLEVAVSLR